MLQELLNRAGRQEPHLTAGQSVNSDPENSRSPPVANASRSPAGDGADPHPGQTNHNIDARGNGSQAGDYQHAHAGPDQSRHPHSHTIAIFEIALPDMPANMMPDSFQGPDGGPPQPFGPNAFRSFMVPFPGMGEGHDIVNPTEDQNNGSSASQSAGNTQSEFSTSANEGISGPSGPTTSGGVSGNQPPRPHLHRWMSDSERRPTPSFPLPPMMNLPPLEHLSESESTPIERRRGDEKWQIPQVKETFAEWVLMREKALHWRCDDPVCLYAPPEHPYTDETQEEWQKWKPTLESLTRINSYKQHQFVGEEYTGPRPVCQHEFHPSCLKVSCLSSNWWYRHPGREETTVRCPKCRMQGWVIDQPSDVHADLLPVAPASEPA